MESKYEIVGSVYGVPIKKYPAGFGGIRPGRRKRTRVSKAMKKEARLRLNQRFQNLLTDFWMKFNRARGRTEKLALLRQMAAVRLFNPAPYKDRRNAPISLRVFGDCRVCSNDARHRHHIIQVKNGGPNKHKNLILLCEACHCEIHPWMTVTVPNEMSETMARVAREPDVLLATAAQPQFHTAQFCHPQLCHPEEYGSQEGSTVRPAVHAQLFILGASRRERGTRRMDLGTIPAD